ncbi:Glycine--tRNA ligase beta subunit [Nitrospira japonica]|uniref:Glycine--tRNA ligase beta subunit n=1 Tax=Nitrospira japonica TaxID=1325564 RepID=A0A1W1IAI6_9BACT|nr:glycine--tRNA ligase subunit beta [Nitrospira japonica]SLM50034.1 Glycine--tRNA ligase beta subunit [Nitrospira japonica]
MNKHTARPSATKVAKSPARRDGGELLLEIGTEELPYHFIVPALAHLKEQATRALTEARLSYGALRSYGTPRRLVLIVDGLALRQASVVKEAMGPSKAVAFDAGGQPTKAALGFAAGQGIAVESLQVRATPKGEYVFAVKQDAGRPAKAVLQELLPQLVGGLTFPKAMKWNESGVRFARPVRWILAVFAGAVLPIQAAGLTAGNRTYGHRVKAGHRPIIVRDAKSYEAALERGGVLVDPERRRTLIQSQLNRLCATAGFALHADESLLDQAVFTTEWPQALIGGFKPDYLAVPSDILMTSMKEHQGFFSVRNKNTDALAPHFIAVANTQIKDLSLIRAGNERVLAARLADAKFFFDEDRKVRLGARVAKLAGVTFHQKLGTMGQKQERVRKLAEFLAAQADPGDAELGRICGRAGALCKADLLTGIVGEFPELQGIMGGEYARHDGESAAVAQAVREQYLPKALEGELPGSLPGQLLSMADRLDSIAAFFHVGLVPTGSEDPFALRRHATAIVRIVLEGGLRLDLRCAIEEARALVVAEGFKGTPESEQSVRRITDFVFERVRHYGRTVHRLRDDVMDAVLRAVSGTALDLADVLRRMQALQAVTLEPEFDPLIVGFKRASRIVEKEQWNREPVNPALFSHPAEEALHRQADERRKDFEVEMKQGRYDRALGHLVRLKPVIDEFFTGVMVNAEDPAVRGNRLSLLKTVDEFFKSFADFSRIMVQGG